MSTALLILTILACWRIGRLIAVDTITEPLRQWGASRSEWLGYLLSCPWCISMWTSPFLVGASLVWPGSDWTFLIMAALAASGVTGMLQAVEDRLDR